MGEELLELLAEPEEGVAERFEAAEKAIAVGGIEAVDAAGRLACGTAGDAPELTTAAGEIIVAAADGPRDVPGGGKVLATLMGTGVALAGTGGCGGADSAAYSLRRDCNSARKRSGI
jgi:hypothetical protein